MTEDRLLRLFQARDERALTAAAAQYGTLCRTIAYRILGDRQDAEECVNDVLMKLWNAIPPAEPRSLTAFVSGITRNLALDRLSASRAEKRGGGEAAAALDELAPYLKSEEDLEAHADVIALQEAMERFLRSLPKEQRMVFLSRYYSMQPIAEIAKAHATTTGRVKMILKRTKEKLRVYLKEEGFL
ncbi:MAG: sigma-70 family RNA polymerase sigma factor [Oscillospiraceae bacterium]|nr:sigma-70 family RNA polymerase sigma factor [Oscillospiraceae bacterium]